jgi:hypothetical protein
MSDVRAECRRLYGHVPCISILGADGETVIETRECDTWCPVLNKAIAENDDEGGMDGRNS